MIAGLLHLVILVVVLGLVLWLLLWAAETFFGPIPPKVRAAVGIIALVVILLYALRLFGVA